MSKLSKIILNVFLVGTIFFLGSYFGYKSNGVELQGLLYAGVVSLIGLVVTSTVSLFRKNKSTSM
ncbi:hypothetical protein [Bacillus altitudinis]|uniref:hypothetical protein n=1 Tax=Bacillus altitudinis TaxID=293387 RepID=UPI00068178F0|nr:hypothetical protein [Bacillus altitudinis]AKU33475.1 hypothetical protein ID12_19410 [Bacillus altitudinis]